VIRPLGVSEIGRAPSDPMGYLIRPFPPMANCTC